MQKRLERYDNEVKRGDNLRAICIPSVADIAFGTTYQ